MINYLIGRPVLIGKSLSVVVGGVGYEVIVSPQTLSAVSSLDQVKIHIHTHVKEDRIELYGFTSTEEKTVFKMLIGISGVGPKTGILMFDKGTEALVQAVQEANVAFFKAIPRVGKKLAQKIIIDLKSKLGSLKELNLKPLSPQQSQLTDALLGLGFDEAKIVLVLEEIETEKLPLEESLKLAMQKITSV